MVRGKIESNTNGNRVVIDPDTREIRLVSSTGKDVMKIFFDTDESGWHAPIIEMYHYAGDNILWTSKITAVEISFSDKNGNLGWLSANGVGIGDNNRYFRASKDYDNDNNQIMKVQMGGVPMFGRYVPNNTLCYKNSTLGEDSVRILCLK